MNFKLIGNLLRHVGINYIGADQGAAYLDGTNRSVGRG